MSNDKSIFPSINKDIIKGEWKKIEGKVKQTWGKITNDDVLKMKGSYEELEGILQQKYGYNKEEASREISNFLNREGLDKTESNLAAAKEDFNKAKDNLAE